MKKINIVNWNKSIGDNYAVWFQLNDFLEETNYTDSKIDHWILEM